MTDAEWVDYYRRIQLRDQRRAQLETDLEWSDAPRRAWTRTASRQRHVPMRRDVAHVKVRAGR